MLEISLSQILSKLLIDDLMWIQVREAQCSWNGFNWGINSTSKFKFPVIYYFQRFLVLKLNCFWLQQLFDFVSFQICSQKPYYRRDDLANLKWSYCFSLQIASSNLSRQSSLLCQAVEDSNWWKLQASSLGSCCKLIRDRERVLLMSFNFFLSLTFS